MAIAIHGPSGGGTDVSGATAAAGQVLSPYTFIGAAGTLETGSILSKTAHTYTPGTASQQISAGQYLSGAQTIAGDANLAAANIVSGKSIFGVAGSAAAVRGTNMDGMPALMSYDNNTIYIAGQVNLTNGFALAIYYASLSLPETDKQVFAFNLIVPPNDWDNQWWQFVYYSSSQKKYVLVSSHAMSGEQYKCSCTYNNSNGISTIVVPALEGLSLPLGNAYRRSIVYF